MPATKGGGGAAVVLGYLLRAIVRILYSFSVAWAAECLCTKSVGDGCAQVVSHLLRDHPGVDGTPVPLLLERLAEPVDTVEDYRLHFDTSGAIGVPNGFDPEIEIDVFAIFVDKSFP